MEVKSVWDDMWERYSVFEKIIYAIGTIAMGIVGLGVFLAIIALDTYAVVFTWSKGGSSSVAAIFFGLISVAGIIAMIDAFLHPKVGS